MSTTEPSNDHEPRFHALVDYAEQLSGGVDALLIASGHDEPLVRDEMPNGLLFELDYLCRVQFDATLHDLRHPWLSHAAPTHLRPLLEGLAQIAFILGRQAGKEWAHRLAGVARSAIWSRRCSPIRPTCTSNQPWALPLASVRTGKWWPAAASALLPQLELRELPAAPAVVARDSN